MMKLSVLIILIYFWSFSYAYNVRRSRIKPPPPKYSLNPSMGQQDEIVDSEIDMWDPKYGTNIWEHSGLFEGDIMLYNSELVSKNGVINESARWPKATIPYFIDDSFTVEETYAILTAMQEYHNKTCVRFRPFVQTDPAWIDIKQDYSGCWSSVGMKTGGQVVNLGSEKCRRHGVIIHELMHAIGFYHQQSASNRDDFIIIHWDNIRKGREHNFNKYNESIVTNFGIPYDYDSVMHYSSKAFSKNGAITIQPIYESSTLGQRVGLSEKDVSKINSMYSDKCNNDTINAVEAHVQMQTQQQEVVPTQFSENYFDSLFKWFESLISLDFIFDAFENKKQ